jgi:hypothetical protein
MRRRARHGWLEHRRIDLLIVIALFGVALRALGHLL